MESNKCYMRWIPGVVVTVFLGCFFAFAYWGHLSHAEDYQLFQMTVDYFFDCVARPGGLVNYVARFLTQFFYYPVLGAFVIALLYGSMYYGVMLLYRDWDNAKNWIVSSVGVMLSLLASTLMLDLTAVYSGTLALVMTLWAVVLWRCLVQKIRMMMLPIVVFVVFWLIGGVAALAVVLFAICDMIVDRRRDMLSMMMVFVSLVVAVVMPFFARSVFGVQLPFRRVMFGADLSRFIAVVDPMVFVVYLVIAILPLVGLFGKISKRVMLGMSSLFVVGGVVAFVVNMSMYNEGNMRYCSYARKQNWREIMRLADEMSPTNRASLIYLNLSLGKTNTLGENMFRYQQYGIDGLVHPFIMETNICLALSDVYYQLGFINSSERMAFEGMKAVSDYQESVRCVERLAETNMIKGEYDVAIKYYTYLENTLFYKEKARVGLEYARRRSIEGVGQWEEKRKCIMKDNFFFSENEHDMMLGLLFQSNQQNKLAFDYLMAYCLLNRDVEHYVEYAPIGGHLYTTMPKAFREAYIYYLSLHNPQRLMNNNMGALDRNYVNRMQRFRDIYVKNPKDARLSKDFSDTYWYYLLTE